MNSRIPQSVLLPWRHAGVETVELSYDPSAAPWLPWQVLEIADASFSTLTLLGRLELMLGPRGFRCERQSPPGRRLRLLVRRDEGNWTPADRR